jgi:hypothetical protein
MVRITPVTTYLYGTLITLFLVMEVLPAGLLRRITAVLIALTILLTFARARWSSRLIASLFLATGMWVLLTHDATADTFLLSFGNMLFVVAFFTVLPVVSLPIRVCRYDDTIMTFIQDKARSLRSEYLSILAISYFYGIFLNLAAVPMSYRSLQPVMRIDNVDQKERFLYFSMSQGFTTPLIWTPFSGMLGTIMVAFEVAWFSVLPLLLVLSLTVLSLCFLLHWLFLRRHEKVPALTATSDDLNGPYGWRLFELIVIVLCLLVTVVILETLFELGLITSIVVMAFPFAYLWCLFKGRVSALNQQLYQYATVQLPRMHDSYMVFLSAGFFVGTIQQTGLDQVISDMALALMNGLDPRLIYAGLPVLVIAFSFMGLHPIVLLVLLTGSINFTSVGLDPILLALSYLCGGVSTFLISPFSGTVGLLKSYTDRSMGDVILTNVPTVLILYTVFMIAIQWLTGSTLIADMG